MADDSTVGVYPTVRLTTARRGGPKDWATVVLLLVCAATIGWSIMRSDWGALMVAAGIGVSQVAARWWWAHKSTPAEIRGYLVVPRGRWWQDKRCTVSFRSSGVVIRRIVEPEAWDVPWTAVGTVEVAQGGRSRLTLVVDGTPLAEVCSVVHSARLTSYLTAAGLPPPR
jgi:hypothetical protein